MIIKTNIEKVSGNDGFTIVVSEGNIVIPLFITKEDFEWEKVGELTEFAIKTLQEKLKELA